MTPATVFGAQLRRRMTMAGMTGAAVASATGVHVRTVWDWRNGKQIPRRDIAAMLASCLLADELVELATAAHQWTCDQCGEVFYREQVRARYCTKICGDRYRREHRDTSLIENERTGVCTPTVVHIPFNDLCH